METEIKGREEAGAGSEGQVKKQGWAAWRQGGLRRGREQVQSTAGCPRPSWNEQAAAQASPTRMTGLEHSQGDPWLHSERSEDTDSLKERGMGELHISRVTLGAS